MSTKHLATSAITGETFKRDARSSGRVYSHAVIIHFKPWKHPSTGAEYPGYRRAEWRSTYQLAEQNARSWRRLDHVAAVEVAEAVRS